MEKIRFPSRGVECAGDLFLPVGSGDGNRRPAIVLGQGFSSVKDGVLEQARYFAERGYVTLAIDYRTFGESDGEPRGQVFPLEEVEDFRSGLSYLELRDEVDPARIGLWGTSFAGGIVIYAAAMDRRVAAVVAQMPVVDGRRWLRSLRTSEQWEQLLDLVEEDRRRRFATGEGGRIPAIASFRSGEMCAMPTDDEITAASLAGLEIYPHARADITIESIERVIEYSPASVIHLVAPRPLCIVTTAGYDIVHPLDQIQDAFARALEPKKLVLVRCRQMDMYVPPRMYEGLEAAVSWFDEHLVAARVG